MEKIYITNNNLEMLLTQKICIYGIGTLGDTIGKYLTEVGITDYFYTVDDEYYVQMIYNHIVIRFREILRHLDDWNIIWAIGDYDHFLNRYDSFNRLFFIFNPYKFWEYKDLSKDQLLKISNSKLYYEDELSINVLDAYLKAMNTGNADNDFEFSCGNKYFNELTKNIGDGVYVDCGAFDGDTIKAFRKYYNTTNKILAFEADYTNYLKLKELLDENTEVFNLGLWDNTCTLSFSDGSGQRSEVSNNGKSSIEVVSLDDFLKNRKTSISYLKIGNDYAINIINGAKETIQYDMPIISLFMVYSPALFYEIPNLLRSLENDSKRYKFYLRHHCPGTCGLLYLYAIPTDKR